MIDFKYGLDIKQALAIIYHRRQQELKGLLGLINEFWTLDNIQDESGKFTFKIDNVKEIE